MTDWATFAVATVALTLLLLYFTRRSQRTLERIRIVDDASDLAGDPPDASSDDDATAASDVALDAASDAAPDAASDAAPDAASDAATVSHDPDRRSGPTLTTTLLLANLTVSQGVALGALVAVAWWTGVPASAFGLDVVPASFALGWGVAAGVALYAGNEVAAALGTRVGATAPERLREAMAPTDARGWAFLLVVVLPVIALFEEALFRGALIGAFAVGFEIDPWLLAVASSIAFGLGHGAQGRLGIAVSGVLGFALATLFVYTGSLLVVVVAHYVVNALEFVVREGLEYEPAAALR